MSFARSWQAVEMALRRKSDADRNRSLGLIYIDVTDDEVAAKPKKEKGWFSSLFSSDEGEMKANQTSEYSVRVQSQGVAVTNVTLEKSNTCPPLIFLRRFSSSYVRHFSSFAPVQSSPLRFCVPVFDLREIIIRKRLLCLWPIKFWLPMTTCLFALHVPSIVVKSLRLLVD